MRLQSLRSSAVITLTFCLSVIAVGQIEIQYGRSGRLDVRSTDNESNQCNRKIFYDAVLGSRAVSSGFAPAHDVHKYGYGPIADGLSIKFGYTEKDVISAPFQVEVTRNYTQSGEDFVYYDLSSLDGNPLWKRNRALIPSDPDCQPITCLKGKKVCTEGSYHKGQDPSYNPVMGCSADSSLKVFLCSIGK